jgi:ribosomal protein S12 methylthiotransferase accessory factor
VALWRLNSSYRSRRPARTCVAAEALMPALGISRVADITRMDRLGLPVCISVRPRSRTLCVHAGKGVDLAEARAGALMEAVEYAAAEPANSVWDLRSLPVDDLVAQFGDGLRLVDFVPARGARVHARRPIHAVECEELVTRRRAFVPAELVFVPYAPQGMPRLFGATTNGLASGNTLVEATFHGLLEVLERDAVSMNKPRDASRWVDHDDLPEPFRTLASDWHRMGVDLAVRQVPCALSLPCFEAFLHEGGSTDVNLAGGSGLHVDRDLALARAVCEAAQSRLSHIHGGRDDITTFYAKYAPQARARARAEPSRSDAARVARLLDRSRTVRYAAVPHDPPAGRSLGQLLEALLARLAQAGFGAVFRHRFRLELNGLHVVKVIVPRCEDVESAPWRIGPRLWAEVLRGG